MTCVGELAELATLAISAEAVVGPTPNSVAALAARASARTWATMRSSHQQICSSMSIQYKCARCNASRARHPGQLVAGVLDYAGQQLAQRIGALRNDQSESSQQAADAIDQRRAFF